MGYGFTQTSGNKNVIALYDDSGVQVAGYSYGPFGQLLSASGPLAAVNPLRFSSEYFDDETGLVYYNYRYYSPRLGRWLSRDPIGEEGGLNLYGMLGNDAVNAWDKSGFWNENIHQYTTVKIAKKLNYKADVADRIGSYDISVDGEPWGLLSTRSYVFNQGYHFNRSSGGEDTRMKYFKYHIDYAKAVCKRRGANYDFREDEMENAVIHLGVSLHPLQDWVAHGDYGKTEPVYITTIHNSKGPAIIYGQNPGAYPDDVTLDVVGSPDGRAAGKFLQTSNTSIDIEYIGATPVLITRIVDEYEFAIYQKGTKRYNLTLHKTQVELNAFKDFLKSSLADQRCRCFFLKE